MNKRSTINDVAERAGVSIKTVSRVINEEPNVRPATLGRVIKAIEELEYRPSVSARGLAGNRSYLLGLLYDNPSASYITNIQAGVLKVCREQSYDLLIHPCEYRAQDLFREIHQFVLQSRVDGLILTPPLTDLHELRDQLTAEKIPCVLVAPASVEETPWSVGTNDRDVCAEMVGHMVDQGHKRIAFILGHPDHLAIKNRFEGFVEGLRRANIEIDETLLAQGYNSFESGVACARELLTGKNRPTAIIAANDDMAAGVLNVAHELGYSMPQDLSVAGFDDVPLASHLWPPLTTISQPIEAMAQAATQLLICKLRSRPVDGLQRLINSRLVIRKSSGPAPETGV